jgi:hypothetical protein
VIENGMRGCRPRRYTSVVPRSQPIMIVAHRLA